MDDDLYTAEERDDLFASLFGFRRTTLLMMFSTIAGLSLLGLLGNVVSMVVWTRPQVKSSSAVLLTALAACDFLILISVNTLYSYSYILQDCYYDSPAFVYMSKFIAPYVIVWCTPVLHTAQTASIYLTLGIALERYIAVCRPFKVRLVCTYRRACWYAVTVITVSILYNLIESLRWKVVARFDENGDIRNYRIEDTELMSQSPLFLSIYRLYNIWLRLILIYLLPFICIAVLNTLIHLELRRAGKQRQTMTFCQRKENRLTWMLFYVVTEFLVCSSVQIFYTIYQILNISGVQFRLSTVRLILLAIFFDTFNSSSNILTYFVFGRGFREALLSTFSCCRGLRSLRRSNGTDDRELDVRRPEVPNSHPSAGIETAGLQV